MSQLLMSWNTTAQLGHGSNVNEAEILTVSDHPFPLLCRNGVLQQLNSEHNGGIVLEKNDAEALLLWASKYV